MRKLKVFYTKLPNMGDLLNELIFQNVFGVEVEHAARHNDFDVMGIGSCLASVFPTRGAAESLVRGARRGAAHLIEACALPKAYVWSTGFLDDPCAGNGRDYRRNIRYLAVRGSLSKSSIERITGKKLDIPVGDGGLLTGEMCDWKRETLYEVGVIPHFREKDCAELALIRQKYPGARVIDLTDEPMRVIREISQCAHIFSSSLHGLVVADCFHVPNMRIRLTDAPKGSGFKFDDYYSAFNLRVKPVEIAEGRVPGLNELIDGYAVPKAMVEDRKKALYDSMNRHLKAHQFV